jgi:sodium-dependent phosphate transporter
MRAQVRSSDPVRRSLVALPLLYALTTFVMVALTLIKSKPTKLIGLGTQLGVAAACALAALLLVRQLVVPRVKRDIEMSFTSAFGGSTHEAAPTASTIAVQGVVEPVAVAEDPPSGHTSGGGGGGGGGGGIELRAVRVSAPVKPEESGSDLQVVSDFAPRGSALPSRPPQEEAAIFVFRYLLVFVATLESFAHGANDTANATSAFAAVWNAFDVGLCVPRRPRLAASARPAPPRRRRRPPLLTAIAHRRATTTMVRHALCGGAPTGTRAQMSRRRGGSCQLLASGLGSAST